MSVATLTSKGQLTVPIEVRKRFGLEAGSQVEFMEGAPGQLILLVKNSDVRQLKGVLPPPSEPLTDERMAQAIDAGWAARAP